MSSAQDLALWVRARLPEGNRPLTHLKLQKLMFYSYGAALAFDLETHLGGAIPFEAWEHGPVNREVWKMYKDYRGEPIAAIDESLAPRYASEVSQCLEDILAIYGAMDAWGLRQESHREIPWKRAYSERLMEIPEEWLRLHFAAKFNPAKSGKRVLYPEYLFRVSDFALDRIPVRGKSSLHELAIAVRTHFSGT